jgi:hypothetical protein
MAARLDAWENESVQGLVAADRRLVQTVAKWRPDRADRHWVRFSVR